MSETSMTQGSRTQATGSGEALIVTIAPEMRMPASTQAEGGIDGIPVRVVADQCTVVLRVDPKVLDEQQKTEELNRNIRRHGKAC